MTTAVNTEVAPSFVVLCKALYGDVVDAELVWEDVFGKSNPDQSDLSTSSKPKRDWAKQVSQASNVVGLTAGAAAIAPTFADERLKGGGPVARKLYSGSTRLTAASNKTRVGRKYAKWAGKGRNPARLALGAAGLQVANVGGDLITSRVLGREQKPQKFTVTKGTDLVPYVHRNTNQNWEWAHPQSPQSPPVTPVTPKARKVRKPGAVARAVSNAATKRPTTTAITGLAGAAYVGRKTAGGGGSAGYYDYAKSDATTVEKSDTTTVEWGGTFTKFDTDKRLAFGWASVTSVDGLPVVDRQNDYIHPNDLEESAYAYVLKSRKGGDMHRRSTEGEDSPFHASDLIESFVLTPEKVEKMGFPKNTKTGWWVGFKVSDNDAWKAIKTGKRTGFSIHGRGKRRLVDYDEAMTASA